MLLKVNAWVMVEVMNGQPGIARFGQVRYTDAAGVCIKTADLETRALTRWEMAIPCIERLAIAEAKRPDLLPRGKLSHCAIKHDETLVLFAVALCLLLTRREYAQADVILKAEIAAGLGGPSLVDIGKTQRNVEGTQGPLCSIYPSCVDPNVTKNNWHRSAPRSEVAHEKGFEAIRYGVLERRRYVSEFLLMAPKHLLPTLLPQTTYLFRHAGKTLISTLRRQGGCLLVKRHIGSLPSVEFRFDLGLLLVKFAQFERPFSLSPHFWGQCNVICSLFFVFKCLPRHFFHLFVRLSEPRQRLVHFSKANPWRCHLVRINKRPKHDLVCQTVPCIIQPNYSSYWWWAAIMKGRNRDTYLSSFLFSHDRGLGRHEGCLIPIGGSLGGHDRGLTLVDDKTLPQDQQGEAGKDECQNGCDDRKGWDPFLQRKPLVVASIVGSLACLGIGIYLMHKGTDLFGQVPQWFANMLIYGGYPISLAIALAFFFWEFFGFLRCWLSVA